MHRDDFSGPVNVASPNPIPQREMMRIIRVELGVPFGLPATRSMLEVAAFVHRTEAELILKSRRVVPSRLLAEGFQFRFPRMEDAVREIEGRLRLGLDWNDRTESANGANHSELGFDTARRNSVGLI
jgi:NAD dependent epimerase/dehydratase family enzyme